MAARSDYRTVPDLPDMGTAGRFARAFAYVLLVLTCTVVAALGGYQIGVRSMPAAEISAADRDSSVREAVSAAVAEQAARDRALRRAALAKAMRWQRAKLEAEFTTRLDAERLSNAEQAARAYRRGKQAGKVAATKAIATEEAAKAASAEPAVDDPTAVPPAPEDGAAPG